MLNVNLKNLQKNQYKEALKRLDMMNISMHWFLLFRFKREIALSNFNNRIVNLPIGIKNLVTTFEKDNEAIVYHVIESHSNFGIIFCLLYVSNNEEQWDSEFITDDKTNRFFVLSKMIFIEKAERSRIEIIPIRFTRQLFKYSNAIKKPESVLIFNKKLKHPAF
jgi:hypothetical protein